VADKKISDLTETTTPASDDWAVIETSGGNSRKVKLRNSNPFSGALVKKSADQTTANYSAFPVVTWDAEEYDTDTYHDNATNNSRLTVAVAGYYQVGGQINVSNGTASDYVRLALTRYNSSSVAQNAIGLPQPIIEISATPSVAVFATAMPVLCAAGDYFELNFDTETDTSITVAANTSWFGIWRVG
jgi:hypothetical protein